MHRQAFPLPPSNVEFDKSLLAPPKTTLTQLSNGVKAILLLRTSAQTASFGADFGSFQVASEDGGGHIGGVGVFVDAGSRLEGNQYMGATHFLQVTEYRTPSQPHDILTCLKRCHSAPDFTNRSAPAHGDILVPVVPRTFGRLLVDPPVQHLAFKSTSSRSHLRLVRDIENIGANTTAVASRENIM